ncbi:fumble protein [Toxoplasma gondii TgCatPRC2]|uniref:Fumble protein n=1 Tax=Toxoplasma gondii TgCatPRC2 TaxID=1130821 RepID=A0A151GZP2_TOXGO|nr:fumble protein [Toxoplasma gondii TgCatPRC2]
MTHVYRRVDVLEFWSVFSVHKIGEAFFSSLMQPSEDGASDLLSRCVCPVREQCDPRASMAWSQSAAGVVDPDASFWKSRDTLFSEISRPHSFACPRRDDRCLHHCSCRNCPCTSSVCDENSVHAAAEASAPDETQQLKGDWTGCNEPACVSSLASNPRLFSPLAAGRGQGFGDKGSGDEGFGASRPQGCRKGPSAFVNRRRCHCSCGTGMRPCQLDQLRQCKAARQRPNSNNLEATPSDAPNPPDPGAPVRSERLLASALPLSLPGSSRRGPGSYSWNFCRPCRCRYCGERSLPRRRSSASEPRQPSSVSAAPAQRPSRSRRSLSPAFVLYPPHHPPCLTTASAARLLELVRNGGPSDRCAVDIGGTLAKVVFVTKSGATGDSCASDRYQTPKITSKCWRHAEQLSPTLGAQRRELNSLATGTTDVPQTPAGDTQDSGTGFNAKRQFRGRSDSDIDTVDHHEGSSATSASKKQPHANEACCEDRESPRTRAPSSAIQESAPVPACARANEPGGSLDQSEVAASFVQRSLGKTADFLCQRTPCTVAAPRLSTASPDPALHSFPGDSAADEGHRMPLHAELEPPVSENVPGHTPDLTGGRRRQCVRCHCRSDRKARASLTIRATPEHVIRFTYFHTKDVSSLLQFLKANGFAQPGVVLRATGGGAHKFSALFLERLGVQLKKLDEMESIMKGLVCLASSTDSVFRFDLQKKQRIHVHVTTPLYPFLVVNIGSGVSILKATSPSSFVRVTGTCIGGGTVLGLARLLFHAKTFKQVVKLSQRGTDLLDLKVGDLFGDAAGSRCLPADTLASSFGRLYLMTSQEDGNLLRKNLRKEDVARSLIHMVSYNLGYLAYLVGTAHGVRRIFFAGKYINNHEFTMESITHGVNFYMRQYDAAAQSVSIPASLQPVDPSCSRNLSSVLSCSSPCGTAVPVTNHEFQKETEEIGRAPVESGRDGHLSAPRLLLSWVQATETENKIFCCSRYARRIHKKGARSKSAPPALGTGRSAGGGQPHAVPDVCVLGDNNRLPSFPPDADFRRQESESHSPLGCGRSLCNHSHWQPPYEKVFTGVDKSHETTCMLEPERGSPGERDGKGCIARSQAHVLARRGGASSTQTRQSVNQGLSISSQENTLPYSPFFSSGQSTHEAQGQDSNINSEPSAAAEASAGSAATRQGPVTRNDRTTQRVLPTGSKAWPQPPPFEVLFLRHDGYLGALGALVAADECPVEKSRC